MVVRSCGCGVVVVVVVVVWRHFWAEKCSETCNICLVEIEVVMEMVVVVVMVGPWL